MSMSVCASVNVICSQWKRHRQHRDRHGGWLLVWLVSLSLGYGLHCHRAVITICKLIGVEDMYAKVEGSVNLLNITRALFTGLANQVSRCQHRQGDLLALGPIAGNLPAKT